MNPVTRWLSHICDFPPDRPYPYRPDPDRFRCEQCGRAWLYRCHITMGDNGGYNAGWRWTRQWRWSRP
jgi:hypothetical protein